MASPTDPSSAPAVTASPLRVGSWVLYDLANTIYIATVTFVFTPYAREVLGSLRGHGVTNFLSMVAAALLVPFFGALVDTTGRTSRYLWITTGLCVAALAGWHLDWGGGWLLLCFFAANLCYNLALLFYNALLTSVAAPEHAGRVSGLGVGIGYLGTILVLMTLLLLDTTERQFFLIAASMFAVLALPCLLFVRERRTPARASGSTAAILREANGRLLETLRGLPRHRPLMWFLLGNFFLVDVLNTAVLYFADFTKDV
ncbi:MAG: MFS transporter, partial [Planctomycetes bacterium]|nr:MFS transporter [Planctomycetota bacterium]